MRYLLIIVVSFFSFCKVNAQAITQTGVDSAFKDDIPDVIYYVSDTLKLKGYLKKPEGKGPFPVFIWNHDREKEPVFNITLAQFWVKHGYIFFMPIRSGQSDNPGVYICDVEKQINRRKEMAQLAFRQIYALHKKANKEVIAALQWIKRQPYVDTNNIVMAGYGYGGTQVLLTAGQDRNSPLGIKCFFAMTPLRGWGKMWGDSLGPIVEKAKRPIFLWQAHSDGDLSLMQKLGPILEKKGFPNRSETLQDAPPTAESLNTFYYYSHPETWEKDVLKYLKDCGVKGRKE